MSKQRLVQYVLAFLVVQCPFQCWVGDRCCSRASVETCSCGNPDEFDGSDLDGPRDDSDPSAPKSSDQCPCGDCFCNGAITTSSVDPPSVMETDVRLQFSFMDVASAACKSCRCGQLPANSLFLPLLASGHCVRAALSSWQIQDPDVLILTACRIPTAVQCLSFDTFRR